MINLSTLPLLVKEKKKRLGRGYGSGKGAKSGRGTTRHQKAREKIKMRYEGGQNPLPKKFPLLRGKGKLKSITKKPIIVSLVKLSFLPSKTRVDIELLIIKKIVGHEARKRGVKVIGNSKLDKAIIVDLPTSQAAKQLIESAGGSVIKKI